MERRLPGGFRGVGEADRGAGRSPSKRPVAFRNGLWHYSFCSPEQNDVTLQQLGSPEARPGTVPTAPSNAPLNTNPPTMKFLLRSHPLVSTLAMLLGCYAAPRIQAATPAAILTQPVDQTVVELLPATFSVVAGVTVQTPLC